MGVWKLPDAARCSSGNMGLEKSLRFLSRQKNYVLSAMSEPLQGEKRAAPLSRSQPELSPVQYGYTPLLCTHKPALYVQEPHARWLIPCPLAASACLYTRDTFTVRTHGTTFLAFRSPGYLFALWYIEFFGLFFCSDSGPPQATLPWTPMVTAVLHLGKCFHGAQAKQ